MGHLSGLPRFRCPLFPCTVHCMAKEGYPWATAGLYILSIAATVTTLSLVSWRLHMAVFWVQAVLIAALLTCALCTSVSDPGIIIRQSERRCNQQRAFLEREGLLDLHTYCDKCKAWRPSWTTHCEWCDCCVTGSDHHCPVSGNHIGGLNVLQFQCMGGFAQLMCYFVLGQLVALAVIGIRAAL